MEFNKVICGNSDILLQEMLSNGITVDLVLTDPPYNLNKDFGNDSDKLSLTRFFENFKKENRIVSRLINADW